MEPESALPEPPLPPPEDVRAARDDLPRHRDQHIPALSEPERVVTVGAGAGARGHPGGQGPGLDPDLTQRARLA